NAMNSLIKLVALRKKEIKAILQMDYDEETKRQLYGDDYNLEEIAQLAPFDILVDAKLKRELNSPLDYVSVWKRFDRAGLLEFTKTWPKHL
ncbi:MAG: hypothetical protein ACRD5B_14065, partial [Nitrososphaeraceae archaeon]